MTTYNKDTWEVFDLMEAEQKIKAAKIEIANGGASLNLVVTGLNDKKYIFTDVRISVQSCVDSILFIVKNEKDVAITFEDGDSTTWLSSLSRGAGTCLMDCFFKFTFLGQWIKRNEIFDIKKVKAYIKDAEAYFDEN